MLSPHKTLVQGLDNPVWVANLSDLGAPVVVVGDNTIAYVESGQPLSRPRPPTPEELLLLRELFGQGQVLKPGQTPPAVLAALRFLGPESGATTTTTSTTITTSSSTSTVRPTTTLPAAVNCRVKRPRTCTTTFICDTPSPPTPAAAAGTT